jgi:phosphatidylinositol 3,5-bisphosphate 5-phosphatase
MPRYLVLRAQHESTSPRTDDGSTHLTPSDDDSDGGRFVGGGESYELRPISSTRDTTQRENKGVPSGEDAGDLSPLLSPQRAPIDSVQNYELYTPDEDRAVRKKLDRKLVGFMALLYLLSFLDRSSEHYFDWIGFSAATIVDMVL